MSQIIQEILEDIYKFDPSLMSKENQLINIIETLIDLKPDTTVDEKFKSDLKMKIMEKIDEMNMYENSAILSNKKSLLYTSRYFFSGVVLSSLVFTLILVVFSKRFPGIDYSMKSIWTSSPQLSQISNDLVQESSTTTWLVITWQSFLADSTIIENSSSSSISQIKTWTKIVKNSTAVPPTSTGSKPVEIAFNQEIKKTVANSFGKLNFAPASNVSGGGERALSAKMSDVSASSDMKIAWSSMYIPRVYKYKYVWSWFSLPVAKMQVYKREPSAVTSDWVVNLIKNIDLNKIDLKQLSDLKIDNITLNEDKEFWLQLNLNFKEWLINIWQNYDKWPRVECTDDACYKRNRMKITDIPADSVVLTLANSFVKKYWINLEWYATWYVDNQWKLEYEKTQNKDDYYIPEIINVIYPLEIDWKEIIEEYWSKKWISVSVDVRNKKVSWVNWLEKISYIASDYDIDTNTWNILKIAEKWWRYWFWYEPENVQYIEVPIWTPSLQYVNIYNYQNGVSVQYVVPAYVFPVMKEASNWDYYSNQIVVPLVKDFYKYDNSGLLRGVEWY